MLLFQELGIQKSKQEVITVVSLEEHCGNVLGLSCVINWSFSTSKKKGKRKVQGVSQTQTAALPRPQEEEETDIFKQAQTEQTYERLFSLPQAR